MNKVVSISAPKTVFDVEVIFDTESGYYVAECDALHLVTEAPSFDALTQRAWEIAPELIELNQIPVRPGGMQLRFSYISEQPALQAM